MFNKKGEMLRIIVLAIPVIIVAGLLFFVVSEILKTGEDSVDREACRTSVLLKEKSKILGRPLIDEVMCETNMVEINSNDEEIIFQDITNEMYDCWYQFGEGKVDFLDGSRDFGSGNNWCFICSRLEFGVDVQDKFGEVGQTEINDFLNYLKIEQVPFSKGETFFEYFYGESHVGTTNFISEDNGLSIDISKPLYVAFLGDKRIDHYEQAKQGTIATTIGTAGGCIVGGVLGLVGGPFGVVGGCVGGSKLGFATAALFVGYQELFVKHGYVSSLYVGDAEGTIDFCNI
ncbi:hypothetical protein HN865_02465 [Candidatus Woesearchaeota archaeon]|nr:hypothetical protein [Candidatus Woesearchaeota archaeon]